MNCQTVILAAGQGTRMKSTLPKVLHSICGKTLVQHVLAACDDGTKPIVITGNGSDQVRALLGDGVLYALQPERKGTGHAVM